MMQRRISLTIILSSILFTTFFYKQNIGLNLLLFEVIVFVLLFYFKRINLNHQTSLIVFAGTLLSAFFVLINNSDISIVVNLLSFLIFIGLILYPQSRSLISSFGIGFLNLFTAQSDFVTSSNQTIDQRPRLKKILKYVKIIFIPILIILLFIFIYRLANPIFEKHLLDFTRTLNRIVNYIFRKLDIIMFLLFLLGLLFSNFIFLGKPNNKIIEFEQSSSDFLIRKRKKHFSKFKKLALINEYKAAIFLLFVLNALILIVNIIDINWVWINFEWNGKYLKQFVHEGTYLLIVSILISIGITLYFFRGNLNFYKKNKFLKILSYIWLFQNGILLISVAIRNFWYIYYFALAYKRIGVFVFLLLTLVGIITVLLKIKDQKTSFFLLRKNTMALYIILVVMTFFNWDIIIAKYNIKHYERSFVHLDFLAGLSEKTLPYLDLDDSKLDDIALSQKELFTFKEKFITTDEFKEIIKKRKHKFTKKWNKTKFFSWNYADYKAYHKLNNKISDNQE
ncbi:MAG: DUF4173 domain-containing protein [Saprospiraceae bacterium]|nr:DUF4173 domain-containing protein [Saprospiraceae bacterium]